MHPSPPDTPARLPDFLCIGTGRSGTTWLQYALRAHPEIYLPEKEIHFFCEAAVTGVDLYQTRGLGWYGSLFAPAPEAAKTGEISPGYADSDVALARIAADLPRVRLIMMLRNPVARAWSAYRYSLSKGHVTGSFDAFLRDPTQGPRALSTGLYCRRIAAWKAAMPEADLLCLFQEDTLADPEGSYRRLCRHIGVSDAFVPEGLGTPVNAAWRRRSPGFERFMVGGVRLLNRIGARGLKQALKRTGIPQALLRLNRAEEIEVAFPPSARRYLQDYYRDEIAELSKLFDRDFSHWLE